MHVQCQKNCQQNNAEEGPLNVIFDITGTSIWWIGPLSDFHLLASELWNPFSAFTLFIRWQEGHPIQKTCSSYFKCCFSSNQTHIFIQVFRCSHLASWSFQWSSSIDFIVDSRNTLFFKFGLNIELVIGRLDQCLLVISSLRELSDFGAWLASKPALWYFA